LSIVEAACHCGSVRLQIANPPAEVTECDCSICRRYGVLWDYYSLDQVTLPPPELTETYAWDDRSIAFHRRRACGCASHWLPIARAENRMGVNARLMDPDIVAKVRVCHLDGAVSESYVH
jgi:hypothetical protein